MNLPHRWVDCAGEWRPRKEQGQTYWVCTDCGTSLLHDDGVMRAAIREHRLARTLTMLTEAGTRMLREETGS